MLLLGPRAWPPPAPQRRGPRGQPRRALPRPPTDKRQLQPRPMPSGPSPSLLLESRRPAAPTSNPPASPAVTLA